MIRVLLVEDEPGFAERFADIVRSDAEFELIAIAPNCAAARAILATQKPDILLADLGLPDGSGIEIIRETAARYPDCDILVVTVFGDEDHVLASIEAGAAGYVLKDSIPQEFLGLLHQLRAGGSPITPVIARKLLTRFKTDASRATETKAVAVADPQTGVLSPRKTGTWAHLHEICLTIGASGGKTAPSCAQQITHVRASLVASQRHPAKTWALAL